MEHIISMEGICCRACGRSIGSDTVIMRSSSGDSFCRRCAHELDAPDLYSYVNTDDGDAALVLDSVTFGSMSKKLEAFHAENICPIRRTAPRRSRLSLMPTAIFSGRQSWSAVQRCR